jgi:hypothetical protein
VVNGPEQCDQGGANGTGGASCSAICTWTQPDMAGGPMDMAQPSPDLSMPADGGVPDGGSSGGSDPDGGNGMSGSGNGGGPGVGGGGGSMDGGTGGRARDGGCDMGGAGTSTGAGCILFLLAAALLARRLSRRPLA